MILPIALIIGGVYMVSKVQQQIGRPAYNEVRGIRNNNPLNIRIGNDWKGEVYGGDEKSFEVFETPEYGIRAAYVVLRNYGSKYGLRTIRGIVDRWAPPIENDVSAYVASVSEHARIDPDEELSEGDFASLIAGMIKHENGFNPYTLEFIRESMRLA